MCCVTIPIRTGSPTGRVSRAGYGTIDPVAETIVIAPDWNAEGIRSIAGTLAFRDYGSYIDDLKRGRTVAIDDTRLDPRTAATSAVLEAISARSFVNMPVTEEGGFVALLFLTHDAARVWRPDELDLIHEVAERTRVVVERRRAEQALRAMTASLEAQVEARTGALMAAEEALRQSQKMEAVGQLTGGIAHDFNNLLTGIIGSLELLDKRIAQGRTDGIDRYTRTAREAAQRAAALTHRLLAFSRRQTLDPNPTDLSTLIGGMEDLIRRSVGPSIMVWVATAPDAWTATVDPNQLENALLNLCINARDAMPDGGRLTIETANRSIEASVARTLEMEPGDYAVLSVTDTGTGMPADVISRAFDPFYTTKPIGKGTGLGLSMVYGFVRQSGGQVRIYSEVGLGTTISLYLPRFQGGEPEAPAIERVFVSAQGELAGVRGGTILLVDDEPAVRALIAEVLEELGYTIIQADNGPAGLLVLLSSARIDLLVTDVGLPGGMNGRQLADAARSRRPNLRVLFITGYAEGAAIGDRDLDPGMYVLTKPFDTRTLVERIGGIFR
jgi:signal transduction histidine kinase